MIFKKLTNKWQLICSENMIQLVPVVTFWSIKVINNPWKGHLKHPKRVTGKNLDEIFLPRNHGFVENENDKQYLTLLSEKIWSSTESWCDGVYFHVCFREWCPAIMLSRVGPKLKRGWCLTRVLSLMGSTAMNSWQRWTSPLEQMELGGFSSWDTPLGKPLRIPEVAVVL